MTRDLAVLVVLAFGAGCSDSATCDAWQTPLPQARLDRPLLTVWGRDGDVYMAGGGVRAASAPPGVFIHHDGKSFQTTETKAGETLWWIWGPDEPGDVWVVGDPGVAYRYDGKKLNKVETGTTAVLFGVWGSGPDDVWLVGGTPVGDGPDDVVLHWDGQRLTPDAPPARGSAFFKVWGGGRDDIWVVGQGGVIWHRTSTGWTLHDVGTRDNLTTVHGCGASEIYAVGGQSLYRWDGERWFRVPDLTTQAAAVGVSCAADTVTVVGNGGLKLRYQRLTNRWLDDTLDEPFYTDFHAAWTSPGGRIWAVGGNYNAPAAAKRVGMLGTFGCSE